MKKFSITFLVVFLVVLFSSGTQKSSGPPLCSSNEPPNLSNCSSCHKGEVVNSGSAVVLLDLGGAENGYSPGLTYTIKITIIKSALESSGFQFIALEDNATEKTPGSFSLVEPTRTQIIDKNSPHVEGCEAGEKIWVEHTYNGIFSNATGSNSWTFQWTAPMSDVGKISFYLSALVANYDLSEEGDVVHTKSIDAVSAITGSSKVFVPSSDIHIFPIPASSNLVVQGNLIDFDNLQITDVFGKVYKNVILNSNLLNLDVSNFPNGTYFIHFVGKNKSTTKKIVVAH